MAISRLELRRYDAASIGPYYLFDDRDLVDKYGLMASPFFRIEISDQSDQILFSAESNIYEGGYDLNGLIVSSVEWDENDCQANMMSLTVQNMDLTLQDSRLFQEGNNIDLWMGYDGHDPEYMGRAIITEIQPTFDHSSIPTIEITAYDIAYFMMEEGRAEVVPEGTAWFERHRQSAATSGGNRPQRVVSNEVSDQQVNAEIRARSGEGPSPPVSVERDVAQLDLSGRPVTSRLVDDTPSNSRSNTEVRTEWRQWRPPRQARSSGKVWREKKDSEIAEAIFLSYGIVPFTNATDERARGRTVTRTQAQENNEIRSDAISDTERELGIRLEEERSGGPQVTPAESIEEDFADLEAGVGISQMPTRLFLVPGQTTGTTVTERTGGRRVVQKSGTTDWEFLKELAKKRAYIVFVFFHYESRRWIGYWGSPTNVSQRVIHTYRYNAGEHTTLSTVRPKISMRGQQTEIDLSYVDPRYGREQRLRISMDNVNPYSSELRGPDGLRAIQEPLGSGPEVVLTIHGRRTAVVANRPFQDAEDARRWLISFWLRHAADFCTIEGEPIIGLPEIRARQIHVITGIGRVSGRFFFTKATHRMTTGSFYSVAFSGYRVVDMMCGYGLDENSNLTVDSNDLGERNPSNG